MKKLIFIFCLFLSIGASAQRIYRVEGQPQRFVNALGIPVMPASYYNNSSDTALIFLDRNDTTTISFKFKGLVKKLGGSRLPWDSLTGVPSNFSTTYGLSNDIQDSLLNKVSRNGSYANPSWITSLDYSKLTGTVPTWNQNTTGNAATVTNGVYTTGSYSDPSWITGLAWSKISGAPAFITGINSSMVTTALGYTPENAANKGIANGYADLDAGGKIPASRIDFGQTGQTFVVASQSAMLAVSGANIGALAIRTDQNKNYRLIAQPASTLANWQVLLSPDAPVQSVNGYTGNVNLLTTHISEGSNYWWTAARSRAAQSLTVSGSSGSATYDNTTGVLNIPTYTLAGLGGQPALSGTGFVKISGTTITYDNSTYLTSYTETDPTIYAWAKATTKPSYSWGEITGTVPTWNQNTTGTASNVTATSNNTLVTLSALSLPYSQLTGTPSIPTVSGTTNYIPKFTGSGTIGNSDLRTDASNNLGLGIAPSAWNAAFKTLQVGTSTALWDAGGALGLSTNVYNDGLNKYIGNGFASRYTQEAGAHGWFTAANNTSGAGATITFTQAMTLTAAGRLGIGTTSPDEMLRVNGNTDGTSRIRLYNQNSEVGVFGSRLGYFGTGGANDLLIYTQSNFTLGALGYVLFTTNGAYERARIATDGTFLINTTTTDGTNKLIVNGGSKITTGAIGTNLSLDINNTGTYGLLGIRRGTQTNASAGINYYTTTAQKWFTGVYENSDNFAIYSVGLATRVIDLNYSTGAATFSSSVTATTYTGATTTVSSSTTIADGIETVFVNNTGATTITVTLPSASGKTGRTLKVIRSGGGFSSNVDVTSVNGGTHTLNCLDAIELVSDGTSWRIVAKYLSTECT